MNKLSYKIEMGPFKSVEVILLIDGKKISESLSGKNYGCRSSIITGSDSFDKDVRDYFIEGKTREDLIGSKFEGLTILEEPPACSFTCCGGIVCKMEITKDTVTWKNFQLFGDQMSFEEEFDKEFVFDKKDYVELFESIKNKDLVAFSKEEISKKMEEAEKKAIPLKRKIN